jgi:hypothetical protein
VEQTNLFSAIKEATRDHLRNSLSCFGAMYIIRYDNTELKLNKGVIINEAKDLPKEILLQFYLNSPFYKEREQYSQNLLNHES